MWGSVGRRRLRPENTNLTDNLTRTVVRRARVCPSVDVVVGFYTTDIVAIQDETRPDTTESIQYGQPQLRPYCISMSYGVVGVKEI